MISTRYNIEMLTNTELVILFWPFVGYIKFIIIIFHPREDNAMGILI